MKNLLLIANYQFSPAAICLAYWYVWLAGWLYSGAPAFAIQHHLLKVGNFTDIITTLLLLAKGKKIKIKYCPLASFSEKKVPENMLLIFWPKFIAVNMIPVKACCSSIYFLNASKSI